MLLFIRINEIDATLGLNCKEGLCKFQIDSVFHTTFDSFIFFMCTLTACCRTVDASERQKSTVCMNKERHGDNIGVKNKRERKKECVKRKGITEILISMGRL